MEASIKEISVIGGKNAWRDVYKSALTTCNGKNVVDPSRSWKYKMLKAEHSVIRQLLVRWTWVDLPYWVSVHLVRHSVGITHFVSSQRSDRTGISRSDLKQDELVNHECIANAQAIINISRKRLCKCASKETSLAWKIFLGTLCEYERELVNCCVRECVYRGFCPEQKKQCPGYNFHSYDRCIYVNL